MQAADRRRFVGLVNALAATFGKEADEAMVAGYWIGLCDLELDQLEHAVTAAIRTCEFMPKVVDLRRLSGEKTAEEQAAKAWKLVVGPTSVNGNTSDPIANEVVRQMGGARRLGHMTVEDLQRWGRRDFERLYAMECKRAAIDRRLPAHKAKEQMPPGAGRILQQLSKRMEA